MSIDGLRPDVLLRARAPNARRLMERGSFTMWARTVPECYTLPAHVSILTGVSPQTHGVEWNDHIEEAYSLVPTVFEVAKRLGAERAGTPIIFVTARDAPEDKIRGLTSGGDDYVTKPFSLEELLALVRNVLRRTGPAEAESSRMSFEDLELD